MNIASQHRRAAALAAIALAFVLPLAACQPAAMGAPAAQTVLRAVPATPSLPADRLERIAQGQAAPAWPSVPADRLEAPHASVYPSDLAEGVTPHPRAISRCIAQLTAQWAAAPEAAAAFCAGERVRLLN